MTDTAFQDCYDDAVSHCYGCGRLNKDGLQIKSYWEGEESVCRFVPRPYHTAIPGYVYGGLIASLIDCHSTGTAAAAALRAEGVALGGQPLPRFVTAMLHVDYLKPTPMGVTLELRSQVKECKPRKVVVATQVLANGQETARGEAVLVRMPDTWVVTGGPAGEGS